LRGDRSTRGVYLERSLRPRNHRFTVRISWRYDIMGREKLRVNHGHERALQLRSIKVTRTSLFVHKGSGGRIADHA
jgi:hypothetical protein